MATYRHDKFCDLVAKGGVTSGVVYPSAIGKLAKEFSFRNLGGTSVGAIAAAAAAAAEYGRRNGRHDHFNLIADLGKELRQETVGKKTKLFNLFQPNTNTHILFAVLTAGIGKSYPYARLVLAMVLYFWPVALVTLGLCGLLAWFTLQHADLLARLVGTGAAIVAGIVFSLLFTAASFICTAIRVLPKNFYGLCTGRSSHSLAENPALSEWFADFLDQLANIRNLTTPLTFGNLWWPDIETGTHKPGYDPSKPNTAEETADRFINLEMITTNVSEGRPYRLPFRYDSDVHENRNFWYREEELRQFLPDRIVDWMMAHPRAYRQPSSRQETMKAIGFYPLPDPWNLPVIAAVRLSLSFPLLLTAVPLYMARQEEKTPEVCWFSDGGICSNFPIHFFDNPIPEWPTFAINLSDKTNPAQHDVLLAQNISQGAELSVTDFDHMYRDLSVNKRSETTNFEKLRAFAKAILFTMHNWNDNTQTVMPGNRDRIVLVNLDPKSGGLNLNMSEETLQALDGLGDSAAKELLARFGKGTSGLDAHRWIRLRASLSAMEEYLVKLDMSRELISKQLDLEQFVLKGDSKHFQWKNGGGDIAWKVITALQALMPDLRNRRPLSTSAPRPRAELRARPRL